MTARCFIRSWIATAKVRIPRTPPAKGGPGDGRSPCVLPPNKSLEADSGGTGGPGEPSSGAGCSISCLAGWSGSVNKTPDRSPSRHFPSGRRWRPDNWNACPRQERRGDPGRRLRRQYCRRGR